MANRKGLTRLITTYAVMELLYTFFVMIFFFLLLNILVNTGIVYPANYPESQLGKVEKDFKSESWTPDQLPFSYEYEYIKNGQVVSSNISETYQPYVKKAQELGRASKDSFIGARVFRYYTTNDKELVVSYKLSPFFASQKLNQLIPHFEGVYLLVVFFVWISGFLFLIVRLTKILKREIKKISTASVYIQQQNLDYPRINSDYKEINDVLSTIDLLANDLKKSLQEQWQMQETKRDLIESVTHDIRTPITLIKGNLELLDEEALTASSSERVKDIEKGVLRLEVYIERLKQISSHVTEEKMPVSEEVLSRWIDVARLLCDTHQRQLSLMETDTSSIPLETENVTMALQNIISNSIEHSNLNSTITLDFRDLETEYRVTITDEGTGFSDLFLASSPSKYVSSKLDNTASHGLGLYHVKEMVKRHNGTLLIENRPEKNQTGAKVTLVFKK